MKTYLFPVALIPLLFFTACNKDDDNSGGDTTKLLSYYTESMYPDTVSFGYNTNDEIILVEGNEDRQTIDINGNQLHYIEFRKTENREVANATFTMNSEGNVVSGQGSFSYSIGSPYTSQFTFTYDSQGNLVNRTDTRSDGHTVAYQFTWANGDLVKNEWIYNDTLYFTQYYEFNTNVEDKIELDWNKFLMGTNSFFGNNTKHLVQHSYDVYAPGSTIVHEYNITFNLDSDGYPITSTYTGISTPSTNVITYHYQ